MDIIDLFIYAVYLIIIAIFAIVVFNIGKKFGPIMRKKLLNKKTPEDIEHEKRIQEIRTRASRESEIAYEEELLNLKIIKAKERAEETVNKTKKGGSSILSGGGSEFKDISKRMEGFWSTESPKSNTNTKSNNMFEFKSNKSDLKPTNMFEIDLKAFKKKKEV